MADQKISELINITGANLADADEFVVVDTSADQTKAITFGELKTAFDTGTGFVRVTGDTMTGDLSFGDGDKAVFGAGSDLQIYHDGYHSIIKEVGSGSLLIDGANIIFRNADVTKTYASMTDGGSIDLYHNNAPKLSTTSTGVDVTGTITADNIVTTGTLSSNKAAGYGAVEVGGPSGGLIDLKAPFSDDYDARIIYNAGAELQITTLSAGEPILLRQGGATQLNTTSTGVSVTGKLDATGSIAVGTATTNGAKLTMESGQDNPTLTGTMATGHFVAQTSSGGPALNVGSDGDGTWYNSAYSNNAGVARNHRWLVGGSEAMQISNSGSVFVGTTVNPITSNTAGISLGSDKIYRATVVSGPAMALNRSTTDGEIVQFRKDGTTVGYISVTGSATAYNTTSDYRLKENITPVQGAADIVKAMKPCTYTFKSDGSWHDGFLAHELQELHPRAVIGSKDGMKDEEYEVTPAVYEDIIIPAVEAVVEVPAVYDDEGVLVSDMVPAVEAQPERTEQQLVSEAVMGTRSVPDYQGVDYSKLTPILTAALQEALNKIDALEARLSALESA